MSQVSNLNADKVNDRRVEVSKLLTVGVATLTAIVTLLGARGGGSGRILANAPTLFIISVGCAALSVLLAVISVMATTRSSGGHGTWLSLVIGSVALLLISILLVLMAQQQAAKLYERPALSVELGKDDLKVGAEIPLLGAREKLTVIVSGFSAETSQSPTQSALPGDQLFRRTTGPAADGTAKVSSAIPRPLSKYKTIEVRAYRGDVDPGCIIVVDKTKPGACVQIQLTGAP